MSQELRLTRRNFLSATGATMAAPIILRSNQAYAADPIKFWDMNWNETAYQNAARAITEGYTPSGDLRKATYQSVQWANFYQTFASAVASRTNPAVSTGGGFQAFQLSGAGAIHYADRVLDAMRSNGVYDDFIDGLVEKMKTPQGYVGVPWHIDVSVLWYRKSILEKYSLKAPTTWHELMTVGQALKKEGINGLISGGGPGNNRGPQTPLNLMISNGGGLFDEQQKPDVMNPKNIEAVDFLLQLVKEEIIAPEAVNYTLNNMIDQWRNGRGAIGFNGPGWGRRMGEQFVGDIVVSSPLVSPNGTAGSLIYVNNVMMYKNNPDIASSEAFVNYYIQNVHKLWDEKVVSFLPAKKSILNSPAVAGDADHQKIVAEWLPNAKTLAERSPQIFPNLGLLDGGQALFKFGQAIYAGNSDAKTILTQLDADLKSVLKI